MIKLYRSLSIFLFLLAAISCSDDDPLPVPMVDFALDPGVVEVGVPVMFDNLSTNASRYEWDLGDGQVVEAISPEATYSSAGDVTVTLRAYTEDNQVDSLSRTFRVHERVLTGWILNNFPVVNGTEAWDPGEAGAAQLPDLILQFTPDDTGNDSGFAAGIFTNVGSGPIGESIDPDDNRVVLSDEDFSFVMFDYDEINPDDGVQPDELVVMTGATFNPITDVPVIKNTEGTAGEIQVVLFDETSVLDVDFFFELQ